MSQKSCRLAFVCALSSLAFYMLWAFVPALAWAGVFGIALMPQYRRLHARFVTPGQGHDILLPLLCTLAVAMVFVVPVGILGVQLSHEAHAAFLWFKQAREHGVPVPSILTSLPLVGGAVSAWWAENLSDPDGAASLLRGYARGSMELSREAGTQVVHRLTQFAFTLVALFFLFRDGESLSVQAHEAAAKAFGLGGERILIQLVASVHGTVNGLVLVGIGEGVIMGVAYVLMGVPHPVMLGAATAVAAMIPFAAPVVFAVAALLLAAKAGTGLAIALFALGIGVTFVADHFIRPGLIGGSTQLPFLWVLLGILGGVESFGLLGLFVGPALMAVLVMLWREWVEHVHVPEQDVSDAPVMHAATPDA